MLVCANLNQPWNSTLHTLVILEKCRTLNEVKQIHARLLTTGVMKNASLTTKIVLSFCSSHHPPLIEFARYIFFSQHAHRNRQSRYDPFLWNAVIKSFSHGDNPEQAVALFCLMLFNGVCADKFSFSLVLKACSRAGLIKEGMQIQCLLEKSEFGCNVFLQNSLICFYFRCGIVGLARRMFDRILKPDSVSWNSMIDGYVKQGMINSARELFDCMPMEEKNLISWNSMISGYAQSECGVVIAWGLFNKMPERDLVSWNSMIDGCVKCGNLSAGHALFEQMPKKDVFTWVNMIAGYAKLGSIEMAWNLFNNMGERDVIAWNAMMAGYVQNGHCVKALELFHLMQNSSNLVPDHATLLVTLSAIAELGCIDEGILIHKYIEENQLPLHGKLGVALIDMYSKCGDIKNAIYIFEGAGERTVDHWNAMIGGLAIHGLADLAIDLFMEMESLSIKPDDITFIGVLNACGHAGLVKEGLMCFELMERVHGIKPKLQHYGCVVDMFGRAGLLEEAKRLVELMPVEPNDVVWRTLLSACINHGNSTIGKQVAKHLFELDSYDSSCYVLLSNLYAGVGMWSDVKRVRMMMNTQDITKVPGYSWIELEGIVHQFFVADKSHPQVREIYSMVDSMPMIHSISPIIDTKVGYQKWLGWSSDE